MKKSTFAFSLVAGCMLTFGFGTLNADNQNAPKNVMSKVAPAAPYMEAYFQLDDAGNGSVRIDLTAPRIDENGVSIPESSLMTIKLTRDCPMLGEYGTSVKTWSQVRPGEPLSTVDSKNMILGQDYVYHTQAIINGEGSSVSSYNFTGGFRPERVSELDVYSNRGNIPVTITAVCPTTLEGDVAFPDGVNLTYVVIRRGEWMSGFPMEEIGRIENVGPGKVIVFEDNDASLTSGVTYTYSVAAGCNYGESRTVYTNITLGEGIPNNVENLTATVQEDGSCLLKWIAPKYGVNNSWIDSDGLKYDIYRYYSEADTRLVVEEYEPSDDDYQGNYVTFTDTFEDLEEPGRFAYQIVVVNDLGTSDFDMNALSNYISAGPVAKLPFYESFNNRKSAMLTPDYAWETIREKGSIGMQVLDYKFFSYNGEWPYVFGFYHEGELNQEGEVKDGFAFCQMSPNMTADVRTSYRSYKLSVANTTNPTLVFKYLDIPNNWTAMRVFYEDTDGKEVKSDYYDIGKRTSGNIQWSEIKVPLEDLRQAMNNKGMFTVRFRFDAEKKNANTYPAGIDEFCLYHAASPVAGTIKCITDDNDCPVISWEAPAFSKYDVPTYAVYVNDQLVGSPLEPSVKVPSLEKGRNYTVKVVAKYSIGDSKPLIDNMCSVNGTGVDGFEVAKVASSSYLNLQGLPVVNPEVGETVILVEKYTDGTVRTTKTIIR